MCPINRKEAGDQNSLRKGSSVRLLMVFDTAILTVFQTLKETQFMEIEQRPADKGSSENSNKDTEIIKTTK